MEKHEQSVAIDNREEFLEFGENSLPEYTKTIWQKSAEKIEPERLEGLVGVLTDIKNGERENAIKALKSNWLSDGLVMGSVATYLPEGVDVVRQVYRETWGDDYKNKDFLDRLEKWHDEQQEMLADEEAEDEDYEDEDSYERGPTTREKLMERVHDIFGPEEARMMAYGMRMDDGTYEAYRVANCFVAKRDEPKGIPNLRQWAMASYDRDLNNYKNHFENALKKARETGSEEAERLFTGWLDGINKYLSDPNANPLYGDGDFPETMKKQEGGGFMHCWDFDTAINRKMGNFDETYGDITARLYMCPRTDCLTDFMDEFKNRCDEKELRYYFKYINYPSIRADRFLIYTNNNLINEHLEVLREMQKERPELFKDMDDGSRNPFWGTIDGAPEGVYFGEEPRHYPRDFEPTNRELYGEKTPKGEDLDATPAFRGYSYSGLRSDVFDIAFEKWAKEVYGEEKTGEIKNINEVIKNEVHFDSPSDISLENAEKLEQMFREELDKADIDPNNMCFDKYPDAPEGPYKRARSYNNSE